MEGRLPGEEQDTLAGQWGETPGTGHNCLPGPELSPGHVAQLSNFLIAQNILQ